MNMHPRDICLSIKVNNSNLSNLNELHKVDEDTETELPREIDSVRLLFNYATVNFNSEFCFLDGELEMTDPFTRSISNFSFKNLFAMEFEEKFFSETRETCVKVMLREGVK